MTEYVVKLRFWLRCWDSMAIDADSDADAIAIAPQIAREMMSAASFPETLEADERREGLISYIDRIDAEGRNEIAEAIEFEGAQRLFPKAAALISRLSELQIEDAQGEDDLRRLLDRFILEAREIAPDVPPLSPRPDKAFR
ncbi:hypothetical protein JQK88_20050 [Mesorhizobium caraganae]|uniref:hypothetical protein n=1 Tax=Mesorhizobium caraganae TaxID=483206 RepID=UPI00193942FB|nr:hypothetical protein [Mesorhizobium caraganae]MBM2713473.1 hypothetical protein [Mesorhizobium caraganae]